MDGGNEEEQETMVAAEVKEDTNQTEADEATSLKITVASAASAGDSAPVSLSMLRIVDEAPEEDDFMDDFFDRNSESFHENGGSLETEGEILIRDDETFQRVKEIYVQIQEVLAKNEKEGVRADEIREEFAALWQGIESSHRNEIRLIQHDRDISAELSATMSKSRYLIKIAEEDPVLARKLGEKLEEAWNQVDIGDAEERANQNTIDQLRQDIFELNRNINSAATVEGHDAMKELLAIKEDLKRERNILILDANKLRSTLNSLFARRQEFFDKRSNLDEKNRLFDDEFQAQKDAALREAARKDRLSVEMEEVRARMENKIAEIEEVEQTIQTTTAKCIDTEKSVHEQRAVNDAALREVEFSVNRIEKLKADFEGQQRLVERMTLDAYRRSQEFRVKEEEVNNLKLELNRATRQRALNVKKVVALHHALATLDIERESLKTKICILEKDLENAQKKLEGNKRRVEDLDKERTFVNRNLKRAVAVTTEHSNQARTHEVAVRTIEKAVRLYSEEIADQKHTVYRLEKERDFYSHEATKLAQQVALRLSDIKKLDISIFHYKKRLGIIETQVKKTQQIYDLAVYDRDVFERTLRDTLAEIVENKTKLGHLNNAVASLKYQVNEKDEEIHREVLRYGRIIKETEFFSKESIRIERLAQDTQRQSEALQTERSTLGCVTAEMEGELSKENYYVTAAQSSSEMYQRKLVEKEVELRRAWGKWKELHSMIRIGAYHYRNIMREITDIRYNVIKARKEAGHMKTYLNYNRLIHEVAMIRNSIAKEKCMINAITEQMRHPINIHRWRVLEATYPEAYELVLNINLLTKRLVDRNANIKEQNVLLNQKQKLYVEIRACIERSPGLEVPEEVEYCKCLLAAKRRQFETLKKDVNSAENQTTFYRDKVKELNCRMIELKEKYFATLKRQTFRNPSPGCPVNFLSNCARAKTAIT